MNTAYPTELVEHIAQGLAQLRNRNGFLRVEVGEYYVQFGAGDCLGHIDFEAVSSTYLPASLQLTQAQMSMLTCLGFRLEAEGNFTQSISIASEEDCDDAARTAVLVILGIYGRSPRAAKLILDLE